MKKIIFLILMSIFSCQAIAMSSGQLQIKLVVLPQMNDLYCKGNYCDLDSNKLSRSLKNEKLYDKDNFSVIKQGKFLTIVF